jgi:hypothetical protein
MKATARMRHLPDIAAWSCWCAILKVHNVSRQSSYVDKFHDANNLITCPHKSMKKPPEKRVITELNVNVIWKGGGALFGYPDWGFSVLFSSVVRQMPGYNLQRWGTACTLPKLLCCSVYCLCVKCVLYWTALYYCHQVSTQLQFNKYINISIYLYINIWIYLYINISIYQYMNISIYQYMNISIYQYMNISIYQYINTSHHSNLTDLKQKEYETENTEK